MWTEGMILKWIFKTGTHIITDICNIANSAKIFSLFKDKNWKFQTVAFWVS